MLDNASEALTWNPEYRFFVTVNGHIESGWEYEEDAEERATEARTETIWGTNPQIFTVRRKLVREEAKKRV